MKNLKIIRIKNKIFYSWSNLTVDTQSIQYSPITTVKKIMPSPLLNAKRKKS